MQLVDARDLAAFMLDAGQDRTPGTFNATAPTGNATFGSWLTDCVDATGSDATLTWVDDKVLLDHEVQPWTELPLWMPAGQDGDAVWQADTERTLRAGMRNRSVRDTVADTWTWIQQAGALPDQPDRSPTCRSRASTRTRSSGSSPTGTPAPHVGHSRRRRPRHAGTTGVSHSSVSQTILKSEPAEEGLEVVGQRAGVDQRRQVAAWPVAAVQHRPAAHPGDPGRTVVRRRRWR